MRITSTQLANVIKELLSPDENRRMLANDAIFYILALIPENKKQTLINDALLLIDNKAAFLSALLSYYANTMHHEFYKRMQLFSFQSDEYKTVKPIARELCSSYDSEYPIEKKCTIRSDMLLLLGIGTLLKSAVTTDDTYLIPQLIACLDHVEPVCYDMAIETLGSIKTGAKAAIPAIKKQLAEKGHNCIPFTTGKTLVNIIDKDDHVFIEMAKELSTQSENLIIEAYCATFNEINSPTTPLIDTLYSFIKTFPQEREWEYWHLLYCLAQLSKKASYKTDEVRELALTLLNHSSTVILSATIRALGFTAKLPDDEPIFIKLSQDEDVEIRTHTHYAVRLIKKPSEALVKATAKDLGNYDSYDGDPHDAVIDALTEWRFFIAPALPEIEHWLQTNLGTDSLDSATLNLLEKMDTLALPLLPILKSYYQLWYNDNQEALEDDEDNDENNELDFEEVSFDDDPNFPKVDYEEIIKMTESFMDEMGIDLSTSTDTLEAEPETDERLELLIKKLDNSRAN